MQPDTSKVTVGANVDLSCRLLVSQIDQLEREMQYSPPPQAGPPPLAQQPAVARVGSFFPFSRRADSGPVAAALLVSSLSLNTSFQSAEGMLDSQSILNAPD
ncbi:Belongs to the protein-tyrosine phosphatase [Homalodisca vitripennis]|nr:Belongs to the protein-tyrosine phosphatase [Homalodisca vitripennis]